MSFPQLLILHYYGVHIDLTYILELDQGYQNHCWQVYSGATLMIFERFKVDAEDSS